MPHTASTIPNTLPKMPFHFIPQAESHLSDHIEDANQTFAKVDIEAARNTALGKLTQQSERNLPSLEGIKNRLIADFLNPENHHSNAFAALKEEFGALKKQYENLKNPQGKHTHTLTSYVESVEKITRSANEKFEEFLKKEKQAFHDAYKGVCTDEGKRKELWQMYEKNLRVNIQAPLEKFTKDIYNLVPQALIHYVNRLGKAKKTSSDIGTVEKWTKEKLERKLQYTDSKGKPIIITKDKKTGQPSEIRIDPMSSLFGSSGDIGDAYAILAAYHGKDVPIRIVVPVFEDDNIYTEMKDFIALLIFLIFAQLYKALEKNHYLKEVKQAAIDKGISLDNISLVDTRGNPLVFSEKDKAKVNKKLQELERDLLAKPEIKPENQNQQPSPPSPTPA